MTFPSIKIKKSRWDASIIRSENARDSARSKFIVVQFWVFIRNWDRQSKFQHWIRCRHVNIETKNQLYIKIRYWKGEPDVEWGFLTRNWCFTLLKNSRGEGMELWWVGRFLLFENTLTDASWSPVTIARKTHQNHGLEPFPDRRLVAPYLPLHYYRKRL